MAVVFFPLVSLVVFGAPNDEALGGHPLGGRGLEFYSVHQVRHSSRILELERQNSVHPSHDRARYLSTRTHYVFTFQDSTLEVVAIETESGRPEVKVFADEEAAMEYWRTKADS